MTKKSRIDGRRTLTGSAKPGAYARSAESRRMEGLAAIPTVERRRAAVQQIVNRAK